MGKSPDPLDAKRLLRTQLVVFVLVAGGVGAFLLLYVLLDGVGQVQRLLIALCVPPALMAVLVGGYFLLTANQTSKTSPADNPPQES